MERFDIRARDLREMPVVDAFINDLVAVCAKHRMSLAHEDTQGAFIVQPYQEENIRWLQNALVELPRSV